MKKILDICQNNMKKVILIEIVILSLVFLILMIVPQKSNEITSDAFTMMAGTITAEGKASIDNSSSFGGTFAQAMLTDVTSGAYVLSVYYDTDYDDNGFFVTSSSQTERSINSDIGDAAEPIALKSYHEKEEIHVWTKGNKADLTISFNYCGAGYLTIDKIIIKKQPPFMLILILFIMFIFFDTWIWEQKKSLDNRISYRTVGVGIVAMVILASLPLLNDYLILGTDMTFHLFRIEGIKEGLLSGQFPVKIQPNWWQEFGYGVSLFYADAFLYFPAILTLGGVSLQNAYKCYIIRINLATAIISYKSFKGIFHDKKAAIVGSFLYTLSLYRLLDIYVRGAVGEFTALTFLPLIALGVYRIYQKQDHKSGTKEMSGWFCLTLGFTGCIQSHLLSCEMVVVFMIIVVLILFFKTFQKKILWEICKAAIATVLLNLWYLVPFFNMYGGNYLFKTDADSLGNIQVRGSFPSQMFSLFINGLVGDQAASNGTSGEMGQSVGLSLAIGFLLLIGIIFVYHEKIRQSENGKGQYKKIIVILILSVIALFMATNYFPYGVIQEKSELLNTLIGHIQFPWRFLGIATLFLVMACASIITIMPLIGYRREITGVIVLLTGLTLVSMSGFYYQILDTDTVITRDYEYLGIHKIMDQTEYLLSGSQVDLLDNKIELSDTNIQVEDYQKEYTTVTVQCSNNNVTEGYIDVPLFFYPCYRAYDVNTGEKMVLSYGENNKIRIMLPAGYTGTIKLEVHERKLWRVAEIISILAAILIIVTEVNQWQRLKKYMKNGITKQ